MIETLLEEIINLAEEYRLGVAGGRLPDIKLDDIIVIVRPLVEKGE